MTFDHILFQMFDYVGVNVKMKYLLLTFCNELVHVHSLCDLDLFQMVDYVVVQDNIFGYMVVKVHFYMTLTFDLEDHICILFLVADYIVVHIKLHSLWPNYCEI